MSGLKFNSTLNKSNKPSRLFSNCLVDVKTSVKRVLKGIWIFKINDIGIKNLNWLSKIWKLFFLFKKPICLSNLSICLFDHCPYNYLFTSSRLFIANWFIINNAFRFLKLFTTNQVLGSYVVIYRYWDFKNLS